MFGWKYAILGLFRNQSVIFTFRFLGMDRRGVSFFLKFVNRLLGFSGKNRTFIAPKAEYVYEKLEKTLRQNTNF